MPIDTFFPDAETLLESPVEEVAYAVLQVAKESPNRGMFHPQSLTTANPWIGTVSAEVQNEVQLALAEGLAWLTAQGLMLPCPGMNGSGGWLMPSRKARGISTAEHFQVVRSQALFPRESVHPAIADTCWLLLARGNLSLAVFNAYRAVEVRVRDACGYDDSSYGAIMMRKAFNPETGPLSDQSQAPTERQALADLMCGAFGSYKNPHSHRIGDIGDVQEAQEMIVLASHLLRIVDARVSRRPAI